MNCEICGETYGNRIWEEGEEKINLCVTCIEAIVSEKKYKYLGNSHYLSVLVENLSLIRWERASIVIGVLFYSGFGGYLTVNIIELRVKNFDVNSYEDIIISYICGSMLVWVITFCATLAGGMMFGICSGIWSWLTRKD